MQLFRKNGIFRNLVVGRLESSRLHSSSLSTELGCVRKPAWGANIPVVLPSVGASTMSSFIDEGRALGIARRYGTALLAVLTALLLSQWSPVHLESAPVSLFLSAVMVS